MKQTETRQKEEYWKELIRTHDDKLIIISILNATPAFRRHQNHYKLIHQCHRLAEGQFWKDGLTWNGGDLDAPNLNSKTSNVYGDGQDLESKEY